MLTPIPRTRYISQKALITKQQEFGKLLLKTLQRNKLRKSDFALMIGKSQAYLTRLFNGRVTLTVEKMMFLLSVAGAELVLNVRNKQKQKKID